MSDMINNKNFKNVKINKNLKSINPIFEIDISEITKKKIEEELKDIDDIYNYIFNNGEYIFNNNAVFSFNSESQFNKSMYSMFSKGNYLLLKLNDMLYNFDCNDIIKLERIKNESIIITLKNCNEKISISFNNNWNQLYFKYRENYYDTNNQITAETIIYKFFQKLIVNYRINNNNVNIKGF